MRRRDFAFVAKPSSRAPALPITLQLTRALRAFRFRPFNCIDEGRHVGDSWQCVHRVVWCYNLDHAVRCKANANSRPALGSFSDNGCPAAAHCISARAWLTRGCPLASWTEVTERSPDSSTDKEVVRVENDSSR